MLVPFPAALWICSLTPFILKSRLASYGMASNIYRVLLNGGAC